MLILTALLVGGAVWTASSIQRSSADSGRKHQAGAQALLTGMLDMSSAVRGFQLSGRESVVGPFETARQSYSEALIVLRGELDGEAAERLGKVDTLAKEWQEASVDVIAEVRRRGKGQVGNGESRRLLFDAFRAEQRLLERTLDDQRRDAAATASYVVAGLSLLLALLIGFVGDRLVGRRDRAERERLSAEHEFRETQTEFTESMQLVDSEVEAHDLLQRHLERSIADSQVVVLNRNNSADRLEPSTLVADAGIAERLEGAEPRSCLAVRLGREHSHESGAEALMLCAICGAAPGGSTCRPLVVGSEVIGSVLVTHHGPLDEHDHTRLRDSVSQAAPALANLRNLALAEMRAATDALTGLPNRRAIGETLKRMVAQASRTTLPLSALMIDLDHFKTINDLYGHEAGDEVLAGVAGLLTDSLRASDFAGRHGGEEFLVLAPATNTEGALVLAENIRTGIEQLKVEAIEHRLTTSIGIATFPDAASTGSALIRMADRALYSAKEMGRNRVETAHNPGGRGSPRPVAD